jgi:hypothetical protein
MKLCWSEFRFLGILTGALENLVLCLECLDAMIKPKKKIIVNLISFSFFCGAGVESHYLPFLMMSFFGIESLPRLA